MISAGRPDSVGGGVAEIFRDPHKPARFSGGGVVAEIFRDPHKPARFSGGGVVAEIFRDPRLQSGAKFFCPGNRRTRSLKSPSFGNIVFTFPPDFYLFRNSLQKKNIYWIFSEIHCRKKTFTKSLGGAMAPLAPPPGYATVPQ